MIHDVLYVTRGKPPVFPRTLFIVTLKQSVFCHTVNAKAGLHKLYMEKFWNLLSTFARHHEIYLSSCQSGGAFSSCSLLFIILDGFLTGFHGPKVELSLFLIRTQTITTTVTVTFLTEMK